MTGGMIEIKVIDGGNLVAKSDDNLKGIPKFDPGFPL